MEVPRDPLTISEDAVTRLFKEGAREKLPQLETIGVCRRALAYLPQGKKGIVMGVGPNTESWKQRGWETLDINPMTHPDIIANANNLDQVIPPGSVDFIHAENITIDRTASRGVNQGRLLQQSAKALKIGGYFIMTSVNSEGNPNSTLPDRDEYVARMRKHGFEGVVEIKHTVHSKAQPGRFQQRVIYYGKKVREGFVE